MSPRVLVIGLDCAPPALVFDRYRDAMPNVARLLDRGTFGPLRSTVPPITVPAWTSMLSGRDPGELGLYGFRNRVPGSYDLGLATSRDVRVKRVWDWLGEAGRRVAVLFVPLTWPPPPVRGQLVSCFLTPGTDRPWAFPRSLEQEITTRFGPHRPDVPDFRTDDRERLLGDLYATADQHFAMARWVWTEARPDFLMMVEMGTDRFHHAFWHHVDPTHPRHDPASPFARAGRDYYAHLDARIGELLEVVGDETTVLVVSDHGARTMRGGVRVNEWLRREGWLTLRQVPETAVPLAEAEVDWGRTRAWGEGGYYGRIFLNVRGREPEGMIEADAYEETRTQIAGALEAMVGPDGAPLGNVVVRPEQEFRRVRGLAPDLMVFFGDLSHRSLGTVGGATDDGIFCETNDTGPDTCNHDWDGIFVMAGRGGPGRGAVGGLSIYDVTPTILSCMDVPIPPGLLGTARA